MSGDFGKRLAGPGAIALTIKLAGAAVSYGMVVALARMMSVDEYGRFALGFNLAIIAAAFGNCGFATGIMRYWPKYMAARDDAAARGVVMLGYRACSVGGLLVITVALVADATAFPFFTGPHGTEVLVIGCLALLISLGDYSSNLLRAQGSTVAAMLPRDVLWRVLTLVAVGFMFWRGYSISGPLALGLSAGVLCVLVFGQVLEIRQRMSRLLSVRASRNVWREISPSLLSFWASGIIYTLIQQFDVVIVGSLLGHAEAGAYFAAQKTAMLLSLALMAAGLVAAPTMAALYHSGRRTELQQICRRLAPLIAAVTAIGFLILIVMGRQLLGLFDPKFVSAYPILLIIGFGTMIDAISGPNSYLMQMTSLERPYLHVMATCYAGVIVAQLILIPIYGSLGAALASTGGLILWNAWAIAILRRKEGLDTSLLAVVYPPKPFQVSN